MFEELCDELNHYLREHDLPPMSADELACEISGVLDGEESSFVPAPATDERRQELLAAHTWLSDFCRRWEEMEKNENY